MEPADVTESEIASGPARTCDANIAIVRRWLTVGGAGNVDIADEIFAADFRTNGKVVGPAGPKRNVRNRLTGFPDLQLTIEDQFAVGDRVTTRLTWRGTHLGLYSGLAPTGHPVEVMAITVFRLVEGVVIENWTVIDQFSLFGQLGALPPTLLPAQVSQAAVTDPVSDNDPDGRPETGT